MSGSERTIDLNADLGEGFPWDSELLARVTSANVCCGAHASDPETIRATLLEANACGVTVGAHPGYADRDGFGRRELVLTAHEVERLVREQVECLMDLAAEIGVPVRYIKPHGALYNQAQREREIADGVARAGEALGLPLVGQPVGPLATLTSRRGIRYVAEGFADRRYRPDGRLVPRTEPGAVLDDPQEIETQVLALVGQGIETLCVHGDNPRAVGLADLVRSVLERSHVRVKSFVP